MWFLVFIVMFSIQDVFFELGGCVWVVYVCWEVVLLDLYCQIWDVFGQVGIEVELC